MEELLQEVLKEAQEELRQKQGEIGLMGHIYLFIESVDWTEPWIIALLSFHIFTLLFIIVTRKSIDIQSGLFFMLLFAVYMSETLNTWAMDNWESFSRNNYFDTNGTFISFMLSFPMLLNCLVMMINFVGIMGDLLVKTKRAELKHKKNQQIASGEIPSKPTKQD